jgi:HAD superfamily hydrolase (TIGR01549 family)
MARMTFRARGILLDLDGTIVDSREALLEAAKIAFAEMGQDIQKSEIVLKIPKRLELNMPIDDLLNGGDSKRFLETYLKAYYAATDTKTKPFPHMEDTLRRLSGKARLALVTRRHVPKKRIVQELERFDLAKYFQHVITAQDTLNPKPSPESLIECSRLLKVEIGECLVVGDSVIDIRAGKNVGAKTIAVLSGIFSQQELEIEKPDLILESAREIPYFLD